MVGKEKKFITVIRRGNMTRAKRLLEKAVDFKVISYDDTGRIEVSINGIRYEGQGLDMAVYNRLERMRGGKALNYLKKYVELEKVDKGEDR